MTYLIPVSMLILNIVVSILAMVMTVGRLLLPIVLGEPHQSQLNNPLLEEQFGRNHPILDQGLPILFFYLLSTLLLPRLYMFPLLEGKQDLVEFFQQGKGPIEILPFNTPLPTTRFFSLHEKRIMMRIPDRTRYFKAEFLIVILSPY